MARTLAITLALCLIGAVPASAATGAAPRATRWNQALQAAAALSRGHVERALVILQRARRVHDSPALATAAALCQVLDNDRAGARRTLDTGARLGGNYLDVHYWRAVLALEQGQLAAAHQALLHARTLGGDRPHYLMLAALLARRQGQAAKARAALTRLARVRCDLLDPQLYPDSMAGIADALAHQLRDFPQPAAALLTMGNLLWTGRRYRHAETYFRRARAKLPGSPAVLLRLARLRLANADAPAALRLANLALARAPDAAALHALRAEVYLVLGKTDRAQADLARAVRLDPRQALSLSRLADRLWDTGGYGRAERLYRYALKQEPRLASARFGLARALNRRRRYAEATAAFRAAARLSPASERYWLAYALQLEKLGKSDQAARIRAQARRARALTERARRQARHAARQGGTVRRICRVADHGALAAARLMASRLRAPAAVRALIQAHLAARVGRTDSLALAQVAAALRPTRLIWLKADPPTVLTVRGDVEPGVPVVIQQFLMFLDPARFR